MRARPRASAILAKHVRPGRGPRSGGVCDEISSWDFTPQSDFKHNNVCEGGRARLERRENLEKFTSKDHEKLSSPPGIQVKGRKR